jgi:hypothetical protein
MNPEFLRLFSQEEQVLKTFYAYLLLFPQKQAVRLKIWSKFRIHSFGISCWIW